MEHEFYELLGLCGLNKTELAEELGIHRGRVYQWKESPPKYAMAYLRQTKKLLDSQAAVARMGETIVQLSKGKP